MLNFILCLLYLILLPLDINCNKEINLVNRRTLSFFIQDCIVLLLDFQEIQYERENKK